MGKNIHLNYKNILSDFRKNFANKVCIVKTNYKVLEEIKILFKETQLPHLMGWHKLMKASATRMIQLVEDDLFTYESTRYYPQFNQVIDRLKGYNILKSIFYDQDIKVMVVTRDMIPNTMKLDIVFMKDNKNKDIILGLRKDMNTDYYVPTTLYQVKGKNNPFRYRKRTFIKKIYWEKTRD